MSKHREVRRYPYDSTPPEVPGWFLILAFIIILAGFGYASNQDFVDERREECLRKDPRAWEWQEATNICQPKPAPQPTTKRK